MSELYLIAHRVRGEPAFDVATQIACAECSRQAPDVEFPEVVYTATKVDGCPECDGTGFWWIIPTSGHRAYPLMNIPFYDLKIDSGVFDRNGHMVQLSPIDQMHRFEPETFAGLPDHYPDRKAPSLDLSALLGALPQLPAKPIRRR